jgi:hypothetical protein
MTVCGSVACNRTLTHGGTGKGVRVGVGVNVMVGVGVRNGVRVGVGVSVATKNVAVGVGDMVAPKIGPPKVGTPKVGPFWVGKLVGITNIGVDDGVTGKTYTGVELAVWVCANSVLVSVALFCGVTDACGAPSPVCFVRVGDGDGCFACTLAVGVRDS